MQRGFSLVELSIVLVILGLLTGGILGGQALIRAAELRSVATEYQRYISAIHSFRDKYFALPGDMNNATKFWGAADGNDGLNSDCRGAESTGTATCNGNGDGTIQFSPDYEYVRFWQHLSNAGLVESKYNGTYPTGVTTCVPSAGGCLFPGSKLNRAVWTVWAAAPANLSTYVYTGITATNLMGISTVNDTVEDASRFQGYILKPEEAWNIDTKLDDGKPGLGRVLGSRRGICDTGTAGVNTEAAKQAATYRLTDSSVACALLFVDTM